MYGLSFFEALAVWAAMTGLIIGVCFLCGIVLVGLTEKRPQYAPPRIQRVVWTEVQYDGSEVQYTTEEVLEMLSDDGDALMESDRNVGREYPLPKDRGWA
jgi:hypothetical protein